MRERIRRAVELARDEEVRAISRRYFISNGFDGTLTSIGVGIGAYLSGIPDGATVFKVGLGAGVGLATSGVWSVWEIERAEKRAELLSIERAMLTDLGGTDVERRQAGARAINAAMSGLGPTIGILLPLLPFLLVTEAFGLLAATFASVAVGVALLFVFGVYLGALSERNPYVAGARMGLAGLVVAGISIVLPG